jgi:Flagellar motor protein
MNLLLILFIIFYSMSSVDQVKYVALSESLSNVLGKGSVIGKGATIFDGQSGILSGGTPKQPSDKTQSTGSNGKQSKDETVDSTGKSSSDTKSSADEVIKKAEVEAQAREQIQMEALEKNISQIISNLHLEDDMDMIIQENGIVISFSNHLFFDSGKTVLKKGMKEGLSKIAVEINKIDNDILIKGYTDNVPVKNSVYASNWQLSSIRAANVVQYLIENGKVDGKRLSAMGCGENNPVASNKTEAGRSKNRRIEISILFKYKKISN